jgi:hypothetical protein
VKTDGTIEAGDVLIGKYQIETLIGRGGMGLVYRAWHLQLNERVAIKVLRSDVQLDDEAVERFHREAQAAVRLKSEHVARIHDVGAFGDGAPYMVMELLAGSDLGSVVSHHGPTDAQTAVDLMLQACDALAEAHAAGIVHRDVKPSNLFVATRPDGSRIVKILDFGISKSVIGTDLSLTQTASVLGTPAYMSPEQMRSARSVDARTDIWSLGVVLYELVEGHRPFRAETFAEMCVMAAVDPYDPMRRAPELDPVVARCLAKSPDDRFATIAELAAALAPFARDGMRATYYVGRAQRVLDRAASATPLAIRRETSRPVAMPRSRALRAAPWIALAAVGAATATAALAWRLQRTKPAEPEEGERIQMQAIVELDAAPAAVTPDAAIAADASPPDAGSARRPVRHGSAAKRPGSGSAAGSGSGSATKKCNVWESRTGCI